MQLKIQPSQVKQRCRIPANDGTTDRGMALDHIDLGQGHQFQCISMFFGIFQYAFVSYSHRQKYSLHIRNF